LPIGVVTRDHLSPFLFFLFSEILSRLIAREENLGLMHRIKIARTCPPISHLLFADDVIIFSRANMNEVGVVLNCLKTYSSWSVNVLTCQNLLFSLVEIVSPIPKMPLIESLI
jgi:hypothetical protein